MPPFNGESELLIGSSQPVPNQRQALTAADMHALRDEYTRIITSTRAETVWSFGYCSRAR